MNTEKVQQARSQQEARDYAIAWQTWQAEQNLSLDKLIEWQATFEILARKFDLTEEFTENGVI